MYLFERINAWIRDSESSLVNLLSAIAPWLAPLAPAYMTFSHLTRTDFGFPFYIAVSVAAVVEVLGLSAISTILAFWSFNRRRVAEYRKAPVWLAVFSFVMYLTVVLTVNVVMDAASVPNSSLDPAWVQVLSRALLTLLSVPAAVILAVRTQHNELVQTYERERREKKTGRSSPQPVSISGQDRSNGNGNGSAIKKRTFFMDVTSGDFQSWLTDTGQEPTADVVATRYAVSARTAFRWLAELKTNHREN